MTRGDDLIDLVTPFVYRKYLDYDAYEGLRDIHRQIREQGARRDYAGNVKLGEGGIREIEFVAQALQIVRGGREPGLRVRGTLAALEALAARGFLPCTRPGRCAKPTCSCVTSSTACSTGTTARRTSSRTTPRNARCWRTPWAARRSRSSTTRSPRIARSSRLTFAQILGDGGGRAPPGVERRHFASAWEETEWPEGAGRRACAPPATPIPPRCALLLQRVRTSSRYQQLPAASRQRFDVIVPQLLAAASAQPGLEGAQVVFERLLALLETVARRSAYLALVIEHPPLLPRLANLMGASAWAADYLTRHPLLLDELLDASALLAEPDWTVWRAELTRQLAAHPADTEQQMDVLRHFQHAQTFRLLVQDLGGRLTVERLADHLSALADIVLEGALAACWTQMAGADARAAVLRDRRLRQAGRQGTGLCLRPRPRVPVRRRSPTIPMPMRRRCATRASGSASTPGSPARRRRARSTTRTCACGPTARRACW